MSLKQVLLVDLQRQYYFDGTPQRTPTVGGLLKRALNPRFMPVVLCRFANALHLKRLTSLARLISLLNFLLFGIEIAMRCEIGEGVFFPHTVGTVIGARHIGRNAVIYQGVTFGAKELDLGFHGDARPIIGDNVVVGAGAKVLGGITVGNNVVIGANAVVVTSLPDNVVVGGIPARILRQMNGHSVL
jgi:serine O-acetyltransferase